MKSKKLTEKKPKPQTLRQKRAEEIKRVLALAHYTEHKPLTMHALAKRMNMWPGSRLMNLLWDMADAGDLIVTTYTYNHGPIKTRNTFALPPSKLEAAKQLAWSPAA